MKKRTVIDEARELAEADLITFAKLVNPERMYGKVHEEVFRFLQDCNTPNKLLLLPRAHQKSHCIAVWCAWWVTKHPDTTILYISATAELAESQLYAIKNILTSVKYRQYWPEMVNPDEGKREKWSTTAIAVDHPKRKAEGIRDYTIKTAGLTTNTTGWHADIIVPDDVVVPDNAYTGEGRRKTAAAMSQMASIMNTGGMIKACGTRYHPADQYDIWKKQVVPVIDEETDEIVKEEPLWDIFERVVEVNGVFLWPRGSRDDGKMFGFDRKELARIQALYSDRTQFYAQYYNDPNDPESARMSDDRFQYYEPSDVTNSNGVWYYKGDKLNLAAAVDFAYTTNASSDFTAIAVVGINSAEDVFVLDLDRFKTDKISVYYEHIQSMHRKWGFRKLRAEATAAQSVIVRDLKDRISKDGAMIKVDAFKPNRQQGSKEERIEAVLGPRYADLKMYHYRGGHTPALEEELLLARPKNDDLKDVLAAAVEIAVAPKQRREREPSSKRAGYHSRFGGVAF